MLRMEMMKKSRYQKFASMYHAIEGAVGCGKSTTLNLLKLGNLKAIYYDEPYQAFCCFLSYNPLFEVCKDMQANARFAQLHILCPLVLTIQKRMII